MKAYRGFLFLLISLLSISNGGLFAQDRIFHTPPDGYLPGQAIEIEARVEGGESNIRQMNLLFRSADGAHYQERPMKARTGFYRGSIPGEHTSEEGVEYLIIAQTSYGNAITYPEERPYEKPVSVNQEGGMAEQNSQSEEPDSRKQVDKSALIISPKSGAGISQDEILIAVSLYPLGDVDSSSVQLALDGVNITAEANISSALVSYRSENLRPGQHAVRLTFRDTTGQAYTPLTWQFTVLGETEAQESLLNLGGGVSVQTGHHEIRNQIETINSIRANVRGSYNWLDFQGDIYLTSQQDPRLQPRNRYTLRLQAPGVQLDIGDSYPTLSQLGLWNKRVRGLNGRFDLEYVNLHLVYGSAQRAIPGIRYEQGMIGDSLSENPAELVDYSFGRRILAVRPSFGSGQRFQFGLSFISSRDDTGSVEKDPGLEWGGTTPKDNVVLGSDLYLSFDEKRIEWRSSAALSWQNNDISDGALSQGDTLEFGSDATIPVADLPFKPSRISSVFILNGNVEPFLPIPASVDSGFNLSLHPGKLNEYSSLAYQTNLMLNYYNNNLTVGYRRVGPAYQSFGNPYMRRDIAGFSLTDRIRLMSNRLYVNLGYENLREGLSRDTDNQIAFNTYTAGLSVYPGGNYPEINYTFRNYQRSNGIVERTTHIDTLVDYSTQSTRYDTTFIDNRVDNSTMSNTFTLSQPIGLFGLEHNANLSFVRSLKSDQVSRAPGYPAIGYSLNMFSLSLRTEYRIPLSTQLSFSVNDNETGRAGSRFQIVTAGARFRMLNDALIFNGSTRFTRSEGTQEFTRFGFDSSVRYRFLEQHVVNGDLRMERTNSPENNYTNLIFRLRYGYEF